MIGLSTRPRGQVLRQFANEAATPARIDAAIRQYHAETTEPEQAPEVIHHPIDDALQTGESRLLGGAMEIRRPGPSEPQ